MIQFYGYNKCSTCQKAKKYLRTHNISFKDIDITEQPPQKSTLKKILRSGDYHIKQLFNTSGQLYRDMKLKDKMASSTEAQLLDLLSKHGKLIKRPIITDGENYSVGYNEQRLKETWR